MFARSTLMEQIHLSLRLVFPFSTLGEQILGLDHVLHFLKPKRTSKYHSIIISAHICPIFSGMDSPGIGGLEYPSPYATAGRKRRPEGAMAKVPGVCLIWRC